MISTRKIISGLTIASVAILSACGANSSAETDVPSKHVKQNAALTQDYVKPGAPVELSHDFKGFIAPGSSDSINLNFKASPSVVSMTVQVGTDGGLSVTKSAQPSTFSLKTQSVQNMSVPFSAKTQGRHYLNVQVATVDKAGQKMARAFTVPVQVGDPALNPSKPPNPNMQVMPSGEAVIAMEAEETISRPE